VERIVHQILVVLDDFDRCGNQLTQAIQLANLLNSDIHLLHVLRPGWAANRRQQATAQLREIQTRLIPQLGKGHLLHSQCATTDPHKFILHYCERYVIDLVMLQQHRPRPWSRLFFKLNIEKLAKELSCPLINIPASHQPGHFKNIILPVTDQLPLRKMHFASFLTEQQEATVFLVGEQTSHLLERTKQLLAENTQLSIAFLPADNKNIAQASLRYARELGADLILVEAGIESRLPGFLNRLFERFLFSASPVPVMAV